MNEESISMNSGSTLILVESDVNICSWDFTPEAGREMTCSFILAAFWRKYWDAIARKIYKGTTQPVLDEADFILSAHR